MRQLINEFYPLQMGAAIFALTDTVETAADLAARSGGKKELVQLLRAAEGKGQPMMHYIYIYTYTCRCLENFSSLNWISRD